LEDVPYGRILREGWAIILLAAILGAAVAYGITVPMPRTYAASSTLILQVESEQASLFERNQFSQARIKSYPPLVDSPEVVDGVRRDLKLDPAKYSDRDIMKMLSAENTTDTVLLVVTAQAPTAKMSAEIANSAAKHTSTLIEDTENTPGETRYTVTMRQVLPATAPVSPISPQTLPIVGLGLILGLAIGAIASVYRTTTNRRLHTISDVRKACGLPVVGRVPRRSRISPSGRRSQEVQNAAYAETVSNVVALAGADHRGIAIMSASSQPLDAHAVEGLALAYAELGRNAQIDDLRIPARQVTSQVEDAESEPGHELESDLEVEPDLDVEPDDDDELEVESGVETESDADAEPEPESESDSDAESESGTASEPGTEAESDSDVEHAPMQRVVSVADVLERIERHDPTTDTAIVLLDPGMTGAVAELAAHDIPIIISCQVGETTVTDLISVSMRLQVMGIRALGVLMTGAVNGADGAVAESWRASDRYTSASQGDAPTL
jgi:capsular polysaccharide biosynthesis protein